MLGETSYGCSCRIFSVSCVTGTSTYPQTEFWGHIGHQEKDAYLLFHTVIKKQNKRKTAVCYSLGIFKLTNAKKCLLNLSGTRKGTHHEW